MTKRKASSEVTGRRLLHWVAVLAVVVLCGFGSVATAQVTVFAAASTKNALDEAADAFTVATGEDVILSYAASSALARQIQLGAPADVFLSANTTWMDVLETDGLVVSRSRSDLLANDLVLIAHGADAPPLDLAQTDLAELLGDRHLAMALVDAVPAGIYGKAALSALNQWDTVAPKVAQAANVRAALALVSAGAAPLGVVYATDARAEPTVSVVATFAADSHPPIVYPVAAVTAGQQQAAEAFIRFLSGPEGQAIFLRHGFRAARK